MSGFLKPTAGRIHFLGRDITRLPAHRRAHLGICRTFQITTLFRSLSVADNLRLSLEALPHRRRPFLRSAMPAEELLAPHRDFLEEWGLWQLRKVPVAALPYGTQRQLEVVMALLQGPRVLLLDEPMAGCDARAREQMAGLIRRLKGSLAILLVEHDMDFALRLSDELTVLHKGRVIAHGTPEQLRADEQVQRIYFGGEEEGP